MSAELSRRLARLKMYPPIRDLSIEERGTLYRAVHITDDFESLPDRFRHIIAVAEKARDGMPAAIQGDGTAATAPPGQPGATRSR